MGYSIRSMILFETPSDLLMAEVAVKTQGAIVPVRHPLTLWNLSQLVRDELANLMERPVYKSGKYNSYSRSNLPFSCRLSFRIEFANLKVSEQGLDRCTGIRVRTSLNDLEAECFNYTPDFGTYVIGSVVPEQHCVFLPSR